MKECSAVPHARLAEECGASEMVFCVCLKTPWRKLLQKRVTHSFNSMQLQGVVYGKRQILYMGSYVLLDSGSMNKEACTFLIKKISVFFVFLKKVTTKSII